MPDKTCSASTSMPRSKVGMSPAIGVGCAANAVWPMILLVLFSDPLPRGGLEVVAMVIVAFFRNWL
jgi:hypothetical protein